MTGIAYVEGPNASTALDINNQWTNCATAAINEMIKSGLAHFLRSKRPMHAMVPENTAIAKAAVAQAGMPSKASRWAWSRLSNMATWLKAWLR